MIEITGLSHINIIVDSMDTAIEYYKKLFGVLPIQAFPNFKNIGFAKSAGFMENPNIVNVSIIFLQIPNTNLTLELMEYHNPKGLNVMNDKKLTYQIGNVGHIALKINNIEQAFDLIKTLDDTNLISSNPEYKPYKIDDIKENEFYFFDKTLENNISEKEKVCKIVSNIKYFYFIDKYGIQWELEQGHDDIGD